MRHGPMPESVFKNCYQHFNTPILVFSGRLTSYRSLVDSYEYAVANPFVWLV